MKTCTKCKRALPYNEFYQCSSCVDGHQGKCKECWCEDVKLRRLAKIEEYQARDRERGKDPKRKEQRRRITREYEALNSKKKKARVAVSNAVQSGKLEKRPCVYCGELDVEAHHRDYNRPLDVTWVCFRCHREYFHNQIVTVKHG